MMNAMLGAAGSLASGFGGQDMGAPVGDDMSAFSTSFDVNYDFASAGSGSFLGDFGGSGSFTPFDMNVNSFPDFYSSSSIFDSNPYLGF